MINTVSHGLFQEMYKLYASIVWGVICRSVSDEQQREERMKEVFLHLCCEESGRYHTAPDAKEILRITYRIVSGSRHVAE
jgi:hypothetical protein